MSPGRDPIRTPAASTRTPLGSMTTAMAQRPSEAGFALVEVIVSCAVLAIVAMAVLSGIDAASNSSAREKARAVAASLAERDQERLRSMTVAELEQVSAEAPQEPEIGGVKYQVKSEAEWITDDEGGTPACGNSSGNSEYLHIRTTVTSAIVGRNIEPVVIDSIIAPSVAWSNTHGLLGVKVVDRNGAGVPNVRVSPSKSSPAFAPAAQMTDDAGCAIFRQLPIGTYSITLFKAGYVDPDGVAQPVGTQKVAPGALTFRTMEYDVATSANVAIQTNVINNAAARVNSKWPMVSALNARRVSLNRQQANPAGASTVTFPGLYPFKNSAYGFFTGNCSYQSPEASISNYFASNPGSLVADPTLPQPQSVTVLQPPLRLRITSRDGGTSNITSRIQVYAKPVKPASEDCVAPQVRLAIKNWPGGAPWGTNSPDGQSANSNWVVQNDATGFDPGLPYGDWTICLYDTSSRRYQSFPYNNKRVGGATSTTVNSGTWSNTKCTD